MSLKAKSPKTERDETSLESEDIATHQETIPVPFICGTGLVALRWIGPATNMVTKQAEDEPAKK